MESILTLRLHSGSYPIRGAMLDQPAVMAAVALQLPRTPHHEVVELLAGTLHLGDALVELGQALASDVEHVVAGALAVFAQRQHLTDLVKVEP